MRKINIAICDLANDINYGIINGVAMTGDDIGLIDGVALAGDDYGFTSNPAFADIIIILFRYQYL